ncbi:uncharacterized protein LOC122052243 [Zingiber officinale]|uniref:DUF6821 domain-containing protein n=1 Tax=Zingiber officinale TaxID=94328 RepID=A0A8J5IAL3_ZINOF|nr:uncharacterized protein LOC122052243 [Zingiber officinale]KAG6531586.1 hypothetical protein ZIOFF_005401 [Zingiber officinale]
MGGHDEFYDWEILLCSEAGEDSKSFQASSEDNFEDGVIKFDYFVLDSGKYDHKEADGSTHAEEAQADSDIPSWVDPESDSGFVGLTKGGMSFSRIRMDGFKRSPFGSEKGSVDVNEEGGKDLGVEGIREIEARRMVNNDSGELVKIRDSSTELDSQNNCLNKASGGERRETVWWKFPFMLLKFCALKAKPVWLISIAAAILGFMMLGKRLYSMKEKSRSVPFRIILDEKKASQLKIHAARLNEAFSVVRRGPIIRTSLAAARLDPWSVVSIQ